MKEFRLKTKPYKHQLEALEISHDKDEFALFMEMGCGKSKVIIDNFVYLYNQGKVYNVLIVAPKGVYDNWVSREIPAHINEHVNYDMVKWQSSHTKTFLKKLEKMYTIDLNLKILVMNIEAFSTKKGCEFASKFIQHNKSMFVVDESTTIKNQKAKRTANCVRLGKYAYYRRILTGSPVTKSPLDLYSQCMFLNPALLGFSSYYSFRGRYADLVEKRGYGKPYKFITGYKNMDELNETLSKFSHRVLKKDCLDLPEKVYLRRNIEMTPEQSKAYKEIQRFAVTLLSNQKTITINHVITQIIRLHQISCGFTVTDDGVTTEIPSKRLAELVSILEETDGKVIIWANYRYDIQRIAKALIEIYGRESVGTYYGGVEQNERERVIDEFQNLNSPLRFFVGNTQTGGYGITLTAATVVIYYSNNYDLEKRLQSEDRAHRIGQTNKVTYIDIVCERTVDEKIVKALRRKQSIANLVLGEETLTDWLK
jgi:SNF2 family DNA or RNA helicase